MKLKNILRNVTAMALPLALLGSCTGDFEELNTNPYEIDPEELPFEAQFSTPLSFSYPTHQNLFQYWTSLSIDNYGGYFEVPHSNWTMARYDLARGFCGGMHENFMQKIFNNTRRLIKQCDAAGQHDFAAVARIVEAYNLLQYTDTYGPVPYSSVLAADELAERPSSYAYDKQEDIYKAIFAQLDKALEGLDTETAGLASFDCWCNGDRTLWKKIANQLKLRMALRIVKVNPVDAEKYAKEAIQAGVLEDKDILINKSYSNELRRMMDWLDSGIGSSIVAFMNGYNDPRRAVMFTQGYWNKKSDYYGIRVGIDPRDKSTMVEAFSNQLVSSSSPYLWFNAAEATFLRAEWELRWGSLDAAKELYEDAIALSFEERGASGAESYVTSTAKPAKYIDPMSEYSADAPASDISIAWEAGDTEEVRERNLERIITQKWIAIFPLGIEAWSEYRRTGYPRLLPVVENKSGGTVDSRYGMRRIPYPVEEYTENPVHLQAAIDMLGGRDNGGVRVWWDVKPLQ